METLDVQALKGKEVKWGRGKLERSGEGSKKKKMQVLLCKLEMIRKSENSRARSSEDYLSWGLQKQMFQGPGR